MLQQNRWSSLPDEIVAKIISNLNFPQYSTVTISVTTFSVDVFKPVTYTCSEFWNILDNLFTIFTTPSINTFSIYLDVSLYEDQPCIRSILDSWARQLRACNTRDLEIRMVNDYPSSDRFCPPSVFQIHSLVSLELSLCMNEFDQFVSHPIILPNLKELHLTGSVNYGFLGRILSSCPSLIELYFVLNVKPKGKNGPMSISSKNLNQLSIIFDESLNLDDIEVIIDAPILKDLYFHANSSLSSVRMFNSISNLESLELRAGATTKFFNSPTKTIFPNLTHLTLFVSSSEILEAIIFEQKIMPHYCPNLEVLVFNFCILDKFVWDTKGPFVLVEHVKHVELHTGGVRLDRRTLNFVTWLLRSAPVLEKLVIIGYDGLPSDYSLGKAIFCTTLLTCAENTSRCQIKFVDGYKLD